jgi:exosortase
MENTLNGKREGLLNRAPHWIPLLGALALVAVLYWNTFAWWWTEWTAKGSFYAHAVFVPFFVAVMVWRNRERLAAAAWKPSWIGVVPVVLSMIFLMLARRSDVTVVQSLSFMLLMLGGSLLMLGTKWTRILLFPLFFLIMMMPLIPDQLINSIAFPIQMTSASIATKLLNLMTLSATQQGTVIQMEEYKMAVELPCSGFKTLVSLMTFSAAFAYLVEAATWKRWTLFLTTIPLSLVINALRITFIGVVGELISGKAASGFHDYSGFIVLIIAFVFLFNFARLLRCDNFLGIPLYDEPLKPAGAEAKSETAPSESALRAEEELQSVLGPEAGKPQPAAQDEPSQEPQRPWWQEVLALRPGVAQLRRVQPFILALCLILLTTLSVQGIVTRPPKQEPPIATFQVPAEFTVDGDTWKAQQNKDYDKLPKDVQEVLKPSRIVNRTYNSANGHIGFFLTAGNGRKVFHDPHTCFLGSSAVLRDIRTVDIPTKHGTLRMQESHYKYTDMPDEFIMMFCYVVEGQVVQSTEQVRNKMIWQMLFGDSGKPSYFFRVTQQMPGTEEAFRKQMTEFITGLWNEIGPILLGQEAGKEEAAPTPTDETLLP